MVVHARSSICYYCSECSAFIKLFIAPPTISGLNKVCRFCGRVVTGSNSRRYHGPRRAETVSRTKLFLADLILPFISFAPHSWPLNGPNFVEPTEIKFMSFEILARCAVSRL